MKTLILSLNRARVPLPVIPIGACLAAESAAGAGHEVRLLDFMFERNPLKALEREIKAFGPGAIGISVRNIDNNDIRNPVLYAKELPPVMEVVKRNSNAPVVLGGSAISIMPESFLRYTGASFTLAGNAGYTFPGLLEKISKGLAPTDIRGVSWLEDGKIRQGENQTNSLPATPLAPDYKKWINLKAYQTNLATIPIKTKSGCGFKCVYCTYDIIDGGHSFLSSPWEVADAVHKQAGFGFKDIEFVDNVFNYPQDHALSICGEITKRGIKARLQSLELNPRYLDSKLIHYMEQAGFTGIGMTIESASDQVLHKMDKGFNASDVYRAAEAVNNHSIPCMWFFMLGGPGETKATIKETLRFAREKIRPGDVAYVTIGIRVYPGTRLHSIALEESVLSSETKDLLQPVFYVSPGVDYNWMVNELKAAVGNQANIIIAGETNLPGLGAIYRVGYALGVRSPLWRFTPFLRRGLNFWKN